MNQPVASSMRAVLLLLLTTFASQVWGVDCSSTDITLSTQQQVDNFQATYGGGGVCDTVTATLWVEGGDINNLDGVANLISVGGALYIYNNAALSNLDGLANLTSVFGLYISNNAALNNLDGLANLTSGGGYLQIESNATLAFCYGLATLLDEVDDAEPGPGSPPIPDVGGSVAISNNLPGCNSVAEVLSERIFKDGFED
jgi:hypothetical protein